MSKKAGKRELVILLIGQFPHHVPLALEDDEEAIGKVLNERLTACAVEWVHICGLTVRTELVQGFFFADCLPDLHEEYLRRSIQVMQEGNEWRDNN